MEIFTIDLSLACRILYSLIPYEKGVLMGLTVFKFYLSLKTLTW